VDELIARMSESVGIDVELARKSIGIILAFLQKEGPTAEVGQLVAALPGSEAAIAEASATAGGGGIMALGGQLMGAGLSMGQIQSLGKQLFAYGREKAGEDVMGPIVGAVPGLSQFV